MNNFVRESRVLGKKHCFCVGTKRYAEFEIESRGEDDGLMSDDEEKLMAEHLKFHAGEYLMIRTHNREVGWPYPYMIHGVTDRGFLVLAAEDQDLFWSGLKDPVEYWGPRGTGPLDAEQSFVLLTEPAVFFLVRPFLGMSGLRGIVLIDPENTEISPELENLVRCADMNIAWKTVKNMQSDRVIAALNPKNAEMLSEVFGEDEIEWGNRVFLYVTNKKACGIDACKGCYLHSPKEKFGINVCCKGPFMPLNMIDFEADRKCFETYSLTGAV